jgi:hypothetical protein
MSQNKVVSLDNGEINWLRSKVVQVQPISVLIFILLRIHIMTNKLFALGVATVAFAGTTLLNVQTTKADVVSTTGVTSATVIPGASVSSATSISVAAGKNPVAGSLSGSTAAPGVASAGTISGAATSKTSIGGASYSAATAGKKVPSSAVGAAGISGVGSGVVGSFSSTLTEKGFAAGTGTYTGTVQNVNYGYKKY